MRAFQERILDLMIEFDALYYLDDLLKVNHLFGHKNGWRLLQLQKILLWIFLVLRVMFLIRIDDILEGTLGDFKFIIWGNQTMNLINQI